jgi:hypothetical protein
MKKNRVKESDIIVSKVFNRDGKLYEVVYEVSAVFDDFKMYENVQNLFVEKLDKTVTTHYFFKNKLYEALQNYMKLYKPLHMFYQTFYKLTQESTRLYETLHKFKQLLHIFTQDFTQYFSAL